MASTNKRKSTASRGRKKTAKKQAAPIRREIGAGVCAVFALLSVLCCFKMNAAFLNLLTSVFRGLIGAGFYILPFSFIMSFLILFLHDGRPVALRVTCTFLTAALIGSLVQLVGGKFDADWDWSVISALWDGGIDGTAGGVLAGGLASLLEALISRIGAAADTPVARSSRTITANATRLMQNRFSILRYFICFAPITVYARRPAGRTGSFHAKQKEKTVWLHFSH